MQKERLKRSFFFAGKLILSKFANTVIFSIKWESQNAK
jgi:hypothetical protein